MIISFCDVDADRTMKLTVVLGERCPGGAAAAAAATTAASFTLKMLVCLSCCLFNAIKSINPGSPFVLLVTERRNIRHLYSPLTHSLDRLTGDGSLRPPELKITGHVPSSIGGVPDVGFQLTDPGLSRTTARTFPFRPVVRSVTRTGFDSQAKSLHALVQTLAGDVHVQILKQHAGENEKNQ